MTNNDGGAVKCDRAGKHPSCALCNAKEPHVCTDACSSCGIVETATCEPVEVEK